MPRVNSVENWKDREYISIRNISTILGISYASAAKIAEQLPMIRFGPRCRRIPTKAFVNYLDKSTTRGR